MKQTLLCVLCVVVLALCVVGYGRFQVASALNEYSENWEKSHGSCPDEEMADRDWYVTQCDEDGELLQRRHGKSAQTSFSIIAI